MKTGQELITSEKLLPALLEGKVQIIDVRAPVEFKAGSIPFSVNLPIMNDDERARVGTTYKEKGQEAAINLGHQLVKGEIKAERLQSWKSQFLKNPEHTFITCFRGGLRSQTAQKWLHEEGISLSRLAGGYKAMRQLLLQQTLTFSRSKKLWVLTGKTGSGKTKLIKKASHYPSVDLEHFANHRGSAFGSFASAQPSQIDFENHLALDLVRNMSSQQPVLVEDESRLIGSCVIPESFFHSMRNSSVLVLDEPLELRVQNTLQEYVINNSKDPFLFSDLQKSLEKISRKLGGARFAEISADLTLAEKQFREHQDVSACQVWIEKLLNWYYDPLYEASLAKRQFQVLTKGNTEHILSYLEKV